ncbi:hypothetical protein J8M00_10870 [Pseudoalteromonas luteoviolacea]|nr:hypothetical protein [Pseudoalteromonas luteoviolacea]
MLLQIALSFKRSQATNKRIVSRTKKLGLVRTSPIIAKHFVPHMRALKGTHENE